MIIYKATNLVNNKVYIGLTTKSLKTRKIQHIRESITRCKSYFHKALRKYGSNNFQWETIHKVTSKKQLFDLEVKEISKHNSNNPTFGYNQTPGGDITNILIDKSGKNNPFYGKHHSKEQRKLWSKQRKGKNSGSSNYFYGKHLTGTDNGFYGKHHSNQTKSLIGNTNSRRYLVTDNITNHTFIICNLKRFCKENNINYSNAKRWSKHRCKNTPYSFKKLS